MTEVTAQAAALGHKKEKHLIQLRAWQLPLETLVLLAPIAVRPALSSVREGDNVAPLQLLGALGSPQPNPSSKRCKAARGAHWADTMPHTS